MKVLKKIGKALWKFLAETPPDDGRQGWGVKKLKGELRDAKDRTQRAIEDIDKFH